MQCQKPQNSAADYPNKRVVHYLKSSKQVMNNCCNHYEERILLNETYGFLTEKWVD